MSIQGFAAVFAGTGIAVLIGFILLIGLIVALLVFLFIFWILMIIDCVKRKFRNENDKIVWILVLIFLGFIGALIYYFVVKKR